MSRIFLICVFKMRIFKTHRHADTAFCFITLLWQSWNNQTVADQSLWQNTSWTQVRQIRDNCYSCMGLHRQLHLSDISSAFNFNNTFSKQVWNCFSLCGLQLSYAKLLIWNSTSLPAFGFHYRHDLEPLLANFPNCINHSNELLQYTFPNSTMRTSQFLMKSVETKHNGFWRMLRKKKRDTSTGTNEWLNEDIARSSHLIFL